MKSIALCMGLNDFYEHGIARGIVRYAKNQLDWSLYGYGWMFRPIEDLEHWKGDGIIARVESGEDADRLAALDVPVVDVAGAYTGKGFYQITNDDPATGLAAGGYFASLGFEHFAFLGVEGVAWSEKRKQGFLTSLDIHRRELHVFQRSLPWWEQLEDLFELENWGASLPLPCAVFACNDTAGVKFANICHRLGLPIPESIALIGVDNEDILCELSSPALSSIMLDLETIGFRSARLLDQVMAVPGHPLSSELLIPPKGVVERASTNTFKCRDVLVEQAVKAIRTTAPKGGNVSDVLIEVPASRRNLETRFKQAMGRTLHQEITRVRIEHAKNLLRSTNNTMQEIAEESGFNTLQRFFHLFRQTEGSTPGVFRKKFRVE